MEIQNSQYKTINWCSLWFYTWFMFLKLFPLWSTTYNLVNINHFCQRAFSHAASRDFLWTKLRWHNTFWNEILLSELMLINNLMHSLILLYTKLSGLSNDRSYYLNFLDRMLFCRKIWGFLLTKNRKNPLCFSCDNIEYKSR